ncbi:MAG: hypothetical protein U9N73_01010 [Candidatus Auribacterota bacterium]|nr:hypothetical protein [Candidatus Auribacterota bacterium]
MFQPVKDKIDSLMAEGYITRYTSAQLVWERLRTGEPVLFKLLDEEKVVRQIFAEPDKLGTHFRDIPVTDDYCRFHEDPVED